MYEELNYLKLRLLYDISVCYKKEIVGSDLSSSLLFFIDKMFQVTCSSLQKKNH